VSSGLEIPPTLLAIADEVIAVLLAQVDCGCHAALSRSIALRVVGIFRMTATMMTLDFLSASARRLWKEGGTVTACAEGGHVEHAAERRAATPDAARALKLAAIEVVGRYADQGCDLCAADLAEFGQQGDECAGQHCADAWHGGEQPIAVSESGIGGNNLDQALVEQRNVQPQARDAAAIKTPQHWIFEQSQGVFGGNFLVAELAPRSDDLGQALGCRTTLLRRPCRHDGRRAQISMGITNLDPSQRKYGTAFSAELVTAVSTEIGMGFVPSSICWLAMNSNLIPSVALRAVLFKGAGNFVWSLVL
jgi:hypothetical protein